MLEPTKTTTILREIRALRAEVDNITAILNVDIRKPDRLISVKEAAKILNRSIDYVYDLINHGRIGASRATAKANYRLSENEVRRFIGAPDYQPTTTRIQRRLP